MERHSGDRFVAPVDDGFAPIRPGSQHRSGDWHYDSMVVMVAARRSVLPSYLDVDHVPFSLRRRSGDPETAGRWNVIPYQSAFVAPERESLKLIACRAVSRPKYRKPL